MLTIVRGCCCCCLSIIMSMTMMSVVCLWSVQVDPPPPFDPRTVKRPDEPVLRSRPW